MKPQDGVKVGGLPPDEKDHDARPQLALYAQRFGVCRLNRFDEENGGPRTE